VSSHNPAVHVAEFRVEKRHQVAVLPTASYAASYQLPPEKMHQSNNMKLFPFSKHKNRFSKFKKTHKHM